MTHGLKEKRLEFFGNLAHFADHLMLSIGGGEVPVDGSPLLVQRIVLVIRDGHIVAIPESRDRGLASLHTCGHAAVAVVGIAHIAYSKNVACIERLFHGLLVVVEDHAAQHTLAVDLT